MKKLLVILCLVFFSSSYAEIKVKISNEDLKKMAEIQNIRANEAERKAKQKFQKSKLKKNKELKK